MARFVKIICGPTSSGKSDYAFDLAKNSSPTLIISADSRQFYKDIPVISGQDINITPPKGSLLLGQGFLESDQEFSISQFKNFFYTQLKIFPNHHVIVVGGSGLYLKAITENLETLSIPPNKQLREKLEKFSLNELQEQLKTIDIQKFNKLNNSDINNPRRLIRAIEVATASKKSNTKVSKIKDVSFSWIGLKTSFENLEKRITARVLDRLKNGAITEVEQLLQNYKDQTLPIYSTIGVQEIKDFLSKKNDYQTLISKWIMSEVQYAKRQMTWFRKQPQVVWYDKGI